MAKAAKSTASKTTRKTAAKAASKATSKSSTKKTSAAAKSPAAKADKKSSAKKTTAKTAKKATAKKAPAKKAAAKKAPAKKASAKKAPAGKATTKKAAVKQTATKKTAKSTGKSPFDKKFLDEMREALLAERSRYVTSAELLKAEADSLVESREPGDVQFDEESGEGDTLAVERERDLALSAHARAAVEEIDAALARLDAGTYGICAVSEKPIPKERLRAIPWAAERVEYKAGGFGLR